MTSPGWLPKNEPPAEGEELGPFAGALSKKEQRRRIRRRERAITAASQLLEAGVKEMGRIMLTGKVERDRIRAFVALADRANLPAVHELRSIEDVVGTVKTVTINYYEPPPGFSETPPIEVREAVEQWDKEQAAKALPPHTNGDAPEAPHENGEAK